MRLIDADELLESMNKRYGEKKDIVPDNLAEGFMQMDKLIHEQGTFDLEAHDKQIRDSVIDEIIEEFNERMFDSLLFLQQLKEKKNEMQE